MNWDDAVMRPCCWDDHTCPHQAVAVVAWARANGEKGHMLVCRGHLVLVRMKAAIRGIPIVVEGAPDKAVGGQ